MMIFSEITEKTCVKDRCPHLTSLIQTVHDCAAMSTLSKSDYTRCTKTTLTMCQRAEFLFFYGHNEWHTETKKNLTKIRNLFVGAFFKFRECISIKFHMTKRQTF